MNLRHVKLIAGYSARYSLRSGVGLVFLLFAMTFGLMVAHISLRPVEIMRAEMLENGMGGGEEQSPEAEAKATERVLDTLLGQARPVVEWFLGSGDAEEIDDPEQRAAAKADIDAWATHLLDDHPALLSAILMIMLWAWPFIVITGAFDMFSGDIASRGLRYQLLRTERDSIFFGRLLGSLIVFLAVMTLLVVTIVAYMGSKLPFYSWSSLALWGGWGLLALVIVSLPYMAFSAWISASTPSSFGSLTIASLILGAVPLVALLGSATYEFLTYVQYLLPWGFQRYLLHPSPASAGGAAVACLGYTAVFTFLGWRKFTSRDL